MSGRPTLKYKKKKKRKKKKIYLQIYFQNALTLNCIRYPALPLVHNGGVPWNPPQRKPLSHRNFLIIFTPYVYTLITTTFHEKKYIIFVPFQNGGQITDFHFASFRFRPKFEKPLSQRNFSMKFGSNKEIMNTLTLLK